MFTCFFLLVEVYLQLKCFSKNIFGECDYLCATFSFPDLDPSASASLAFGIRSQTVLFTRVSHGHSILLWTLLNCFSYLADWLRPLLLSLGSPTGWRGAAVYSIAGKLVNLKGPGICCCFNTAFACLCLYVSCSAFATASQTLYKRRLSANITSARLRQKLHQKIVCFYAHHIQKKD